MAPIHRRHCQREAAGRGILCRDLHQQTARNVTALWAHNGSFNASVRYPFWVDAAGKSGTVVVFDGMGNPKNMPYTNGLLQITLSEMPQYVLATNMSVLHPNLRVPHGYRTSF
jgi:hypothetical protein